MQDFEISVQAAYVIYNQSAIVVIILAVSKKVSSLASDDQMAPPHRGHSVKNINQQKKTSQAKRKLYNINRETSQIDWFLLF